MVVADLLEYHDNNDSLGHYSVGEQFVPVLELVAEDTVCCWQATPVWGLANQK